MISKMDVKRMPFTFVFGPVFLAFLLVIVLLNYQELIEEKEFIAGLSCPELKNYAQNQIIESKLYFGNDAYLVYAEERYSNAC